jgi:hypothetical protein
LAHLDQCILEQVQRSDPFERTNTRNLRPIEQDPEFQATLDRNNISSDWVMLSNWQSTHSQGVGETQHAESGTTSNNTRASGVRSSLAHRTVRRGLTYSRGGVVMHGAVSSRKRRKNYPPAWGCQPSVMRMKKRVTTVYDGPRRLWKDDMMLSTDYEVRIPTGDASDPSTSSYVTDLDVQTLRRAEALHATTEEERGEWVPDNIYPVHSNAGTEPPAPVS